MIVLQGNLIAPVHQPKERIMSISLREISLMLSCEMSNRSAVDVLNRVLYRDENKSVKLRTYSDFCERTGNKIFECVKKKTTEMLCASGFDPESGEVIDTDKLPAKLKTASKPIKITKAYRKKIDQYNENRSDDEKIKASEFTLENTDKTCYVSIDEIGVKHQKEHRKFEIEKQGQFVWNTVAVVDFQQSPHILVGNDSRQVYCNLQSYLLSNKLLENKNLVFFTDGARDIQSNIERVFAYHPYTVILDWYHLKKRCEEYLSMSIKGGKDIRNEILEKLLRILWAGNTSEAIRYLMSIDKAKLRPNNFITKLSDYFERHKSHIPCYALRKLMGLRNSSNNVEKANDLVVAKRQKHNGMSWSVAGSSALAQIKTVFLNHQQHYWLNDYSLPA